MEFIFRTNGEFLLVHFQYLGSETMKNDYFGAIYCPKMTKSAKKKCFFLIFLLVRDFFPSNKFFLRVSTHFFRFKAPKRDFWPKMTKFGKSSPDPLRNPKFQSLVFFWCDLMVSFLQILIYMKKRLF